MAEEHHLHGKKILNDLRPLSRELRHAIPSVYKGFSELHAGAFAPGDLDVKTKELIALAIAVTEGCDGCMASHSQAAVRAGATRQEAAEAIGVTFLMHGGPATIHGPRAYSAFCEFAEALETGESPPDHVERIPMCHPVMCKTCKKVTWAGCGSHVAQVKAHVPADDWCDGHPKATGDVSSSWLRRIRRSGR